MVTVSCQPLDLPSLPHAPHHSLAVLTAFLPIWLEAQLKCHASAANMHAHQNNWAKKPKPRHEEKKEGKRKITLVRESKLYFIGLLDFISSQTDLCILGLSIFPKLMVKLILYGIRDFWKKVLAVEACYFSTDGQFVLVWCRVMWVTRSSCAVQETSMSNVQRCGAKAANLRFICVFDSDSSGM